MCVPLFVKVVANARLPNIMFLQCAIVLNHVLRGVDFLNIAKGHHPRVLILLLFLKDLFLMQRLAECGLATGRALQG